MQTESISFGYDDNENMTLASNSYGTYTMQYDPLNQLTFVSEPVGVSLTFGYDGDGNRTLEKDSLGGTVQSVYDTADELVTQIYTQSGGTGMQIQQDYNWEVAANSLLAALPRKSVFLRIFGKLAQLAKGRFDRLAAWTPSSSSNRTCAKDGLTLSVCSRSSSCSSDRWIRYSEN